MVGKNYAEVSQVLHDAFEDVILMGADERGVHQILADIVTGLGSLKRPVG